MRWFFFVDESGDFDFSGHPRASRYFVLTSVVLDNCEIGDRLLDLRREMAWEGLPLSAVLHATKDAQAVRDRVFALLAQHHFRIDTSIFSKADTYERVRADPHYFYKLVWYLHLRHVKPRVAGPDDEGLVVGAALATSKKYTLLHNAITDVVTQVSPTTNVRTTYWSAASDPCLQVADYCCWAIQRKWEQDDDRSYVLIRDKIRSEDRAF